MPHKALILHPIVGGREANSMQSREPSQRDNEGVQQAGPPERHALSAILTTLAIPASLRCSQSASLYP